MRRVTPQESGPFGKSMRRSRSKSNTPAAKKEEDPNLAVFGAIWAHARESAEPTKLQPKIIPSGTTSNALVTVDGNAGPLKAAPKVPTEVILRGFEPTFLYAVVRQYEKVAGRIVEDYPRQPDIENSIFGDAVGKQPIHIQPRPMTPAEASKANNYAGGTHWIKVTFESAEAADIAIFSSPLSIFDHLIYAEEWRGKPPSVDAAAPIVHMDQDRNLFFGQRGKASQSLGPSSSKPFASASQPRGQPSTLPRSFGGPSLAKIPGSPSSIDSSNTASTATVTGPELNPPASAAQEIHCRRIPTAVKAKLRPAEEAYLPQRSLTQRLLDHVPFLKPDPIIGNLVPRREDGEFDFAAASYWWLFWYFLDKWFWMWGGNICEKATVEDDL
ncbi:MAG: hypothetical protein M1829_000235 [Trizodia sp. TS-e1964]|nr:MAG: hypothetical protein M1829_000235 [Trizodia sp. TS-e1964]